MKSKAVFLLVIFLLNTVVGLGCALGMQGDHPDEMHSYTKPAVHGHKNSDHHHAAQQEHKAGSIPGSNSPEEDACCKALVNDLVIQSKLIPESVKIQVVLPVVLLPEYAFLLTVPSGAAEPERGVYADRRERPPNEDIRISIQSFQI